MRQPDYLAVTLDRYQPSRSLRSRAPQYLSNCVSTISSSRNRYRLRSSDTADYILPRTRTKFGECGFHHCGPAAWNTLPSDLHDITDTNVFKERLTVLFDRAYWLIIVVIWRSWTVRRAAPYKSLIVFVFVSTHLLSVPFCNTVLGKHRFSVAAPLVWNSLRLDLRTANSLPAFKNNFKTFLFRRDFK